MSSASGKFVLRLNPELHDALARRSHREKVSLNRLCSRLLEDGMTGRTAAEPDWLQAARHTVARIRQHFKSRLVGIAVFGSRVTGDDTPASDVDILVALRTGTPINRSEYIWWDALAENRLFTLNPQFLAIPATPRAAGGIWFEIALHHIILFDPRHRLAGFLNKLNTLQQREAVTRAWSNGHPYWIWKDAHEKQIAQS